MGSAASPAQGPLSQRFEITPDERTFLEKPQHNQLMKLFLILAPPESLIQ